MRMLLMSLILALGLTSMGPATAGPLEDANSAYQAGDYAEAVRLYRLAAEQGEAWAQSELGNMYFQGKGVPQDYTEAVRWYRLAAEKGYAWGQFNLGFSYREGKGIPQDYVLAHMWFNLAAAQGEIAGWHAKTREDLASRMTSDQIAEAQKLAREWMAAHPK